MTDMIDARRVGAEQPDFYVAVGWIDGEWKSTTIFLANGIEDERHYREHWGWSRVRIYRLHDPANDKEKA